MQVVKKTNDYTIIKKRSGRYGVRNKHNVWINGEEKSKVLLKEGFLKVGEVKTEPTIDSKNEEVNKDATSTNDTAQDASIDSSSEAQV